MFYGIIGLFLMGVGIRAVLRSDEPVPDRRLRIMLLFGGSRPSTTSPGEPPWPWPGRSTPT